MLVSIQHEERTIPFIEREMQFIPNTGDFITLTYNETEGKQGGIYIVTDRHFLFTENGEGEGVIIWVTDYELGGKQD